VADLPDDPLAGIDLPDLGGAPPRVPGHDARRERRRALGRLAGIVVFLGLAISFVAENLQGVTVHLWVVDRRMALVWVVAVCLVAGLAVGYWVGWFGHRRALERRAARAARGGRRRRHRPN
jgi:uncharacterized membrane protein YciS (DUF1049 family)